MGGKRPIEGSPIVVGFDDVEYCMHVQTSRKGQDEDALVCIFNRWRG